PGTTLALPPWCDSSPSTCRCRAGRESSSGVALPQFCYPDCRFVTRGFSMPLRFSTRPFPIWRRTALALAFVLWVGLSPVLAERRVALVIGNSDYLDVPAL